MKGYRILLVDDEANVLTAVGDFLRSKGFDVQCAASAEIGLETLDSWRPDLVILDIGMPGIGGLGFLKRLRESAAKSRTDVLVLTARSNMGEFFSGMDVAGFLSKTCSREELIGKINLIMASGKARRGGTQLASHRVIVGEDDVSMGDAIRKALESSGMRVEVLSSGKAVIDRMIESPPEVLVLKEDMAGLKGSLVAQLAAKMPGMRAVPVILHDTSLAGSAVGAPERHRMPEGVTEWVSSSEPEVLVRVVRRLLETK